MKRRAVAGLASDRARAERAHYTAFAPALYSVESVALGQSRARSRALCQRELVEPAWNHAGMIRADKEKDLDAVLDCVTQFYRLRDLPPVVGATGQSRPSDLALRLTQRGWVPVFRHAWLFAPADIGPPALPTEVSIETVESRDDLERFISVFCSSFDDGDPAFTAAAYRGAFRSRPPGGTAISHCIAWVDGQPAACGSLASADGVAGLYNLGVDPSFRRRGLARAITAWRVSAARASGCDLVYLQTEDAEVERFQLRSGFRLGLELRGFQGPPEP